MADLLFGSSMALSSFRAITLSKPVGISTPKRGFRNRLLPKSVSYSGNDANSSSSASVELHFVSTKECSDGSILFRFGDENEIVRSDEVEELEATHERGFTEVDEVSDIDSVKEDKGINTVTELLDTASKMEKANGSEGTAISNEEFELDRDKDEIQVKVKEGLGVVSSDNPVMEAETDGRYEEIEELVEDNASDVKTSDFFQFKEESREKAKVESSNSVLETDSGLLETQIDSESGFNGKSSECSALDVKTSFEIYVHLEEDIAVATDNKSDCIIADSVTDRVDKSDIAQQSIGSLVQDTVLDVETSDSSQILHGSNTNVQVNESYIEKASDDGAVSVAGIDDLTEPQLKNEFDNHTEQAGLDSVSVDISEVEMTTELASSGSGFDIKVPNNNEQEGSKESEIEVTELSKALKEDNMVMMSNSATDGSNDESIMTEVMPKSTTLEAEPIRNDKDEMTHITVDEAAHGLGIEGSEMLDNQKSSLFVEKGTAKSNALSCTVAESSVIGTTLMREGLSTTGFCLSSAAASLRDGSKALTGSGDAYFLTDQSWIGIAEGIGQWSLEGENAGSYAHELMENCGKIVYENKGLSTCNSVEVLSRGARETLTPGFCTVLVAYFDGRALHVANIGDSGFIIVRNGVIVARSSPVVHEFYFPVRIGKGDDPADLIEACKIDLDKGDVIVIATDGLWDNLYQQEIALVVSKSLTDGSKPQEIAECLAMRAQEVGQSESARTPFADAAQAAGYVGVSGGKLGDITVIVSLVE